MKNAYTFKQLKSGKLDMIPESPGIYKVYADKGFEICISKPNPTLKDGEEVVLADVRKRFNNIKEYYSDISECRLLYVGKAKNLNNRIKLYLKYGLGKVNNHRGGKNIFAIKHWENLIVQYETKDLNDYSDAESDAIRCFEREYGDMPLANRVHGKSNVNATLPYPLEIRQGIYNAVKTCKKYVQELYSAGWKNEWPEKCASIDFNYKGKSYRIGYEVFGIDFCDQSMIYKVADVFKKECKGLGLSKVRPFGFLD